MPPRAIPPSESHRACARIVRRAKSNFGFAFALLPRGQRRAMRAVYAFLRIADDLGDAPAERDRAGSLDRWEADFEACLRGEFRHPIHPALCEAVRRYGIDPQFFRDVLAGVRSDLDPPNFGTREELLLYCYRVAGAVGRICLPIWRCPDTPAARSAAESAGRAFQLTNMLRDRYEDLALGRVYLDPARITLPEAAALAEASFAEARHLFPCLPPPGRAVFRAMFDTYYAIFGELRKRGFDMRERVRLPGVRKLSIFAKALPTRLGWTGMGERRQAPMPTAAPRPPARVLIVGGGLAGLAAAVKLAPLGYRVTVLESKARLGGRAGSFTDSASGQLVDACQHVSMGCCDAYAEFCRTTGLDAYLKPERTLHFMTADGRISQFRCDPLPAPFHLSRAFAGLHYFSVFEKARIGYALQKLVRLPAARDEVFGAWLNRNGQTARTVELFWNVVAVSALNLRVEEVGLKYARKVFRDAFWTDPRGLEVQIPRVPLGELYGGKLSEWLKQNGVAVEFNARADRILSNGSGRFTGMKLADGRELSAEFGICAVPFERLPELLPLTVDLEISPISSVHLWFDRPITALPHAVLVDCKGQWLFNRGEVAAGEHYIQIVISASNRSFPEAGNDAIQSAIVAELMRLFPIAKSARLIRCRVVTERRATFAPVPHVDDRRPNSDSPIPNLFLAGDFTQTGWPATMEGAVRSGFLAAERIIG